MFKCLNFVFGPNVMEEVTDYLGGCTFVQCMIYPEHMKHNTKYLNSVSYGPCCT